MTLENFQRGDRYRLKTHIGHRSEGVHTVPSHSDTAYEEYLQRYAPLFTDQIGVVEQVVPAGVQGAGPDDEDVVVLLFDHCDPTTEQQVKGYENSRAVSFTAQQMSDWFEAVGG